MEKERKTKRMVEDPHDLLNHRSSLLCTKCSPENPRDGESDRKVQVNKKERKRQMHIVGTGRSDAAVGLVRR